jgi:multiple sugar transport system ATP-binding protein
MNLLPASAPVLPGDTQVRLAGRDVPVPSVQAPAAGVLLGVRPEHVQLRGADQGCLGGRVTHAEYFGSHWVAEVQTEAGPVKVLADKASRPAPDDRVGLDFATPHVVLFDAASERLLPSATSITHTPRMRHG